jgi:predicted dehydrogenase
VVESPLDAVYMALPHDEYPEYVRLAAQRGLHLLKEKPLARSFDEAASLVRSFEPTGKVFMIATQRRFNPGFAAMKRRLAEAGRPFLVRSHFLFNWNGDFGWRGDRSRAGFGAFGDAGYHNIDLLNWMLGPPQEVYAMQSGRGRESPLHPYDTDDTGLCVLHYANGLMGCLACSWVTQPQVLDVTVHGTRATLSATADRFQVLDLSGKLVDDQQADPADLGRQTALAMLAAFASAIRSGRRDYPSSGREHLLNQAVVEAAYLSGRTGQPQLPGRIFELNAMSIDDSLPKEPAAANRESGNRQQRNR